MICASPACARCRCCCHASGGQAVQMSSPRHRECICRSYNFHPLNYARLKPAVADSMPSATAPFFKSSYFSAVGCELVFRLLAPSSVASCWWIHMYPSLIHPTFNCNSLVKPSVAESPPILQCRLFPIENPVSIEDLSAAEFCARCHLF